MALLAIALPRKFTAKIKGTTLPLADPNPDFTPEQVQNFYSGTYPELLTAKVSGGEIENDAIVYEFSTVLGTKG